MTEAVLIGEAGLERIRKLSTLPSTTKTRLYSLIPFLELSVQQDYIVNRIKELSEGGAMSEFKWNGGGKFKGGPPGKKKIGSRVSFFLHTFWKRDGNLI